jgi:hypothetical protein
MHFGELIKKSFDECSQVIFPKSCLHCGEKVATNFFCDNCLKSFELLEKEKMLTLEDSYPIVTCFVENGPASILLKEMHKMSLPALLKLSASYMSVQYLKSGYPMPDLIIPYVSNFSGFNYLYVLSKEVSKIFKKPIKRLFAIERVALFNDIIGIRKTDLKDKKILLVIDKVDRDEISKIIKELKDRSFKEVYILSLCQN